MIQRRLKAVEVERKIQHDKESDMAVSAIARCYESSSRLVSWFDRCANYRSSLRDGTLESYLLNWVISTMLLATVGFCQNRLPSAQTCSVGTLGDYDVPRVADCGRGQRV